MKLFVWLGLLIGALSFKQTYADFTKPHLMCYYEGANYYKEGLARLTINDLDPALDFCTHLVYGYADIGLTNFGMSESGLSDFELVSNLEKLDMDYGNGMWRTVTGLKNRHPHLKVLLSVGGDRFNVHRNRYSVHAGKYAVVVEQLAAQIDFIRSAQYVLKRYLFDGIDLAWQFPKTRPAKLHHIVANIWNCDQTKIPIAEKSNEKKKELFTAFIRRFKKILELDGLILGLSVMPQVNSSLQFDVPDIIDDLDYVTLHTYDFQTPERNPDFADFAAPIFELDDRNPEFNVQYQVQYWLNQLTPAYKIHVGVAAYGRIWKTTMKSGQTGIPPVVGTDGPGPSGFYTRKRSLLSFAEVCSMFVNRKNYQLIDARGPWQKVSDPAKRSGTYAYYAAHNSSESGSWVSYEDPETASYKADFVRQMGLGGMALMDLSFDDFSGSCFKEIYPILRAMNYALNS